MSNRPPKQPRWSADEIEALDDIATNYPSDMFVEQYNRWALKHGYVRRSRNALLSKASRLGIRCQATGRWVSPRYVAQVLGISIDTPQRWDELGVLIARRDRGGRRAFLRSDVIRLAREQPAVFGGISPDRLFALLEDRELADDIAQRFPRRAIDPKPVKVVETGWRYPTIRAAAAQLYVTRQAIQFALRTGGTCAGYHWSYA